MGNFRKDNKVLKILSIIGVSLNTFILLVILLYEFNIFTFILMSLCFIGVYYPIIKKYKAYKIIDDFRKIKDVNVRLEDNTKINNIEVDLFSKDKNDVFYNRNDKDFEKENSINIKIIDDLKLRNIHLTNKIEDITREYDKDFSNLEYILESADFEYKSALSNVKKEYEDKIRLLEKQIEDMTILTDEKRNELKEEALYEYLSLMKEDYHKRLSGDKEDTKIKSVSTYVAGVKYKNPYGENRQKIIKEYIKDHHDINLFDKYDFNYVSNKDIEEESLYSYEVKYYQYEMEEFDTIRLEKEPNNPYDENAIAIIHEEMGHIGYIPKIDINKVKELMVSGQDLLFRLKLFGGRYKYFDTYEYKVKIKSKPYYFDLIIECM